MQRVRGLISGTIVGVPLATFLMLWLHATREFAALIGIGVGLAIFAVVATRSDATDAAADLAWQAASPDLPPVSDRAALERTQATMPGPGNRRRPPPRPRSDGEESLPGGPETQVAERK